MTGAPLWISGDDGDGYLCVLLSVVVVVMLMFGCL